MLHICQIPVLTDNYIYLCRDAREGCGFVVDPALAEPVLEKAAELGWSIDYILNTHHHGDHVGGNLAIQAATECQIVGPAADAPRIPGIQRQVGQGDRVGIGDLQAQVFDVPGHTRGHIAYYFEEDKALFCGDTLFAMGCGRLFEGTPAQMWQSLSQFIGLPDETRVFCAHEYTQANGRFALSVEPQNSALQTRMRQVNAARAQGKPTVPSTIGLERATNPFLRPDSPDLQATIGMDGTDLVDVFAKTRQMKDTFTG